MGHEGGVCQAGGVTGRKEVEKGISDSRMDGGPRGQQGRGTPRELYGGGCGYCRGRRDLSTDQWAGGPIMQNTPVGFYAGGSWVRFVFCSRDSVGFASTFKVSSQWH